VSNSSKAFEAKQTVENLAQAAMQNQAIDLSAVIKTIRSEGVQEAEEILEAAEDKKRVDNMAMQTAKQQGDATLQPKHITLVRLKYFPPRD
jgi:spore coat protein CotF